MLALLGGSAVASWQWLRARNEATIAGQERTEAETSFRQALAAVEGRDYAIPDDVKRLVVPVFAHRVTLPARGGLAQRHADAAERILADILTLVDIPL